MAFVNIHGNSLLGVYGNSWDNDKSMVDKSEDKEQSMIRKAAR